MGEIWSKMFTERHVKYRYSCRIVIKLEFSRLFFFKYSIIKFHKNPYSGNRNVSCGQTERQTHMTKLIVAFRNFASAPPNWQHCFTGNRLLEKFSHVTLTYIVFHTYTIQTDILVPYAGYGCSLYQHEIHSN